MPVGHTLRVPLRVKTGNRYTPRFVEVERTTYGRTNWRTVSTLITNTSGAANVHIRLATIGRWSYRVKVMPTLFAAGYTSGRRVITVVSEPLIKRLSSTSSTPLGGSTIVISGANLTPATKVTFGGTSATIISSTATRLRVVVPPGLPGAAQVIVYAAGGKSAPAHFRYVMPVASATSSYTPLSTTVTAGADDAQWVTGGPDPADVADTQQNPWVVSLAPGATVPGVGAGYLIKPGGVAIPSGLAGTVTSLASQQDGTTRVTLTSTPLDQILKSSSVSYAGDTTVVAPRARSASPGASTAASSFGGGVTYPKLNSSVFDCTNRLGKAVSFDGSVNITFSRFEPVAYFYTYPKPNFAAYVTGTVEVSGAASVSEDMSCKLKPLWADAHRRIIPLGDTGATVSVGPTATLSLSAAGTVEISQTTRFMYGVTKDPNSPARMVHIAKSQDTTFSLNAELTAKVSAGVSVQLGLLDRVGAEMKGQLYGEGSLTAPIVSSHPKSCTQLTLGFSIGIDAYLDLFIARWESPSFSLKIGYSPYKACSPVPPTVPITSDPAISSSTLPNAQVGSAYSTTLMTADHRAGGWLLIGGSLPPGLTLARDGTISGTPTRGVGAWHPIVTFTDEDGRKATATLFVTVIPSDGLGGGDIQATLTWNSPADLDLHALESDGNEIYYGNPGPSADGGELDHDANAGCTVVDPDPAENIHWPAGRAAAGTYRIWVQTYSTCTTSNLSWHLVVRVRGTVVVNTTGSGTSQEYSLHFGAGATTPTVTQRAVPLHKLAQNAPKTYKQSRS